jgi:hypothetical protein
VCSTCQEILIMHPKKALLCWTNDWADAGWKFTSLGDCECAEAEKETGSTVLEQKGIRAFKDEIDQAYLTIDWS